MVTREVRTGERNGSPTRVVVARRSYPTDQADLWDVLTNPERIPRWFLPVSGDLELGGRYQFEGNAGGTIEECVESESFSLTWVFGGSTSWLTVLLSATTRWAEAAIADGDDPAEARAAGVASAAFYTPQSD